MAVQQTHDGPDNNSLAISPALIVGIVIVAALFCTIVFASLYRLCSRRSNNNGMSSAAFRAQDAEDMGINPDDFWNPNRQRTAAQVTRMKEVRWINNMYAWERGRQARIESGEIRPPTMMMGRKGENRSWDEYTIAEDSSGQDSSGNGTGEYPGGPFFYNADNPYTRFSSHQRLSHLVPPTFYGRTSYMSSGSGNGGLPREPSALLPPPINEPVGTFFRRSPLRHEYQSNSPPPNFRSARELQEEIPTRSDMRVVVQDHEETASESRNAGNPIITVNDHSQDISDFHNPFKSDSNFETISLTDGDRHLKTSDDKNLSPSVDPNIAPCNFSRPREGTIATPTQRPSVIVSQGSLPQLQLQFASPLVRTQQTASSVYNEDEGVDLGQWQQRNTPTLSNQSSHDGGSENRLLGGDAATPESQVGNVDSLEEHGRDVRSELAHDNVKGMIQDWERVNGRFGREF